MYKSRFVEIATGVWVDADYVLGIATREVIAYVPVLLTHADAMRPAFRSLVSLSCEPRGDVPSDLEAEEVLRRIRAALEEE